MKNSVEFLITVNSAFPHDLNFLSMNERVMHEMGEYFDKAKNTEPKHNNHAEKLYNLAQSHFHQYAEGKSGKWALSNQGFENDYGRRREKGTIFYTKLSSNRYRESFEKIIKDCNIGLHESGDFPVKHKFLDGRELITSVLSANHNEEWPDHKVLSRQTYGLFVRQMSNQKYFIAHSPWMGFMATEFTLIAMKC